MRVGDRLDVRDPGAVRFRGTERMAFLGSCGIKAGSSWPRTGLPTAIGIGFLVAPAHVTFLDFPRGLLQDAVELPWPIG